MKLSEDASHSYQTVGEMYSDYFLDYASYVILDRAIPHISDGMKNVQRRILHALDKLDDGRFNKVANAVGDTMKYHPHGDQSIGAAIVGLGQKKLLLETQGNWGNILTGDPAAAVRYIETRLSPFAREVLFSPKITEWQLSYDGRNKEPITFPAKFPLVLAQGAEGIAVGLSCKILPHNFNELCDGAIAVLENREFELLPDFPTGGIMDATDYRDGQRGGGRVRVRAKIQKESSKTLRIREIPWGTTTGDLIDSIVKASEKGKIKILKIEDNTAENADIYVHFPPGTDLEQAEKALYGFSDCEVSLSPISCVIRDNHPHFMGVSEILAWSANNTRDILESEQRVALQELEDKWHMASLEKIFIEEKIYRDIEECETWESVLQAIEVGLQPFISRLFRPVTSEEIERLTEIKIKRISRYDAFQADRLLEDLQAKMLEIRHNIEHITEFTISWFQYLKGKYGKNWPRKTKCEAFDTVNLVQVAAATETLYLDAMNGFAGWGLKKETPIEKCSTMDDVIVISSDGKFKVSKIAEKFFVGKRPLKIAIFRRDEEKIYHILYRDGKDGPLIAKRVRLGGITRDKEYDLLPGTPGSRIFFFAVHDSEAESSAQALNVILKPALRLRNLQREFYFSDLAIRGRSSRGNIVTRHAVDRVVRLQNPIPKEEIPDLFSLMESTQKQDPTSETTE